MSDQGYAVFNSKSRRNKSYSFEEENMTVWPIFAAEAAPLALRLDSIILTSTRILFSANIIEFSS